MTGGPFAALDSWRLIRRYAVPDWMIAECTDARERGDWRAACSAARVTVAFDDARPVAGLLAGFAPDLLRWHLPRALDGSAALVSRMRYVLAPDGPVTPDTVVLGVRSPGRTSSTQRLTLHAVRAGDMTQGQVFPLPPHMWDARRAAELPPDPPPAPGRGPWTSAGWSFDGGGGRWSPQEVDLLRHIEPRAAGRELRRVAAQFGQWSWELRADRGNPYAWWPALRLVVGADRTWVVRNGGGSSRSGPLRADLCLHPMTLRAPVDLDLVRHGRIGVEELHPLVRAALFPVANPADAPVPAALPAALPARPAVRLAAELASGVAAGVAAKFPAGVAGERLRLAAGVAGEFPAGVAGELPAGVVGGRFRLAAGVAGELPAGFAGERFRVRCGGGWHWIVLRGGHRLELPHHTEDERRRELALRAFGGTIGGCFKAETAWLGGEGVVPSRLRAHRRDLWRRIGHGGARVVTALLDAGMDPHIRDGRGRTLLHHIHRLEHATLLPRLLAAGLDVNAVCRRGYTPMCEAVAHSAPDDLLTALNDAGAVPRLSLPDPRGWPVTG